MGWEGGEKRKHTTVRLTINHRSWVWYNKKWYDPQEWYEYCRKVGINPMKGNFRDIWGVLEEAQRIIMRRVQEGKDITHYLPKYFEFEKRVRDYYYSRSRMFS